jgi:hypothetical protein
MLQEESCSEGSTFRKIILSAFEVGLEYIEKW